MAQIGLKYLFYHTFLHFDLIVYLVAFLDISQGTNAIIPLSEQQWRWALVLSCVSISFRIASFFMKQAIKQLEIDEKRLTNEKLQQEARALKLENDRKQIENEALKRKG